MESRPGPHSTVAAHLVHLSHSSAVDRHECGHYDLHAGVGADAAGNDVVAGDAHHSARQYHRTGSDDSQCPRRHEVRRIVSGAVPRELRSERRECAGGLAGARRMRLVRHSNVDWRACPEHVGRCRLAAMEQSRSGSMDVVRGLLAGAGLDHSERSRRHQEARRLVRAPSARGWCDFAWLGDLSRRWPPVCARSIGAAAGAASPVLAVIPGCTDSERWLLGNSEPQHPGFHTLCEKPAVAGDRPGAWVCPPP